MEIAIVGGNVAGISTALHLKWKLPDASIKVYEPNIWNKPCGGAISVEFYEYFKRTHGMALEEASYKPNYNIAFWKSEGITIPSPFVITTRFDLQNELLLKAQSQGIEIMRKKVFKDDLNLFTEQTIVAAGYSGISRDLLDRKWKRNDLVTVIRVADWFNDIEHINTQSIIFDTKYVGYGWLFRGRSNYLNFGYGALLRTNKIKRRFLEFVKILNARFGCNLSIGDVNPDIWGLPMPARKNYPVSNQKYGCEFIGVGDAIGVAHPFLGAGIEPAWQSGWILAECFNEEKERINTKKYQKLLIKNINKTSQRLLDRIFSRYMRSRIFSCLPGKEHLSKAIAIIFLPLFIRSLLPKVKKYPFYKLVCLS